MRIFSWVLVLSLGMVGYAVGDTLWSYSGKTGSRFWGDLMAEYRLCSTGTMQSPINILRPQRVSHDVVLETTYEQGIAWLMPDRPRHQVNFAVRDAGGVVVNGETYTLEEIHLHNPSEHQIAGLTYPMEIQYIHRNASGDVLAMAILARTAPTKNRVIEPLIQAVVDAGAPVEQVKGLLLNPNQLLPSGQTFFRYIGSATAPPCTEGWTWFVFRVPITVSSGQVVSLLNKAGRNARVAGTDYLRGVKEWTPSVYLGD